MNTKWHQILFRVGKLGQVRGRADKTGETTLDSVGERVRLGARERLGWRLS